MTHEIQLLFQTLKTWQEKDKKAVFISVVELEGSSYRRPGVCMIMSQEGEILEDMDTFQSYERLLSKYRHRAGL